MCCDQNAPTRPRASTICTSVWQGQRGNSLLSVLVWMEALISKLCSRWASMYQLGVQKAPLALDRHREQPIEWTSHHDCDCRRKRKNIVGARTNVKTRCLNNYSVALADITVMSLYFRGGPGFQSPPSPCASHRWLTGSQPHDWAYPLHVVPPANTGAMFFFVSLHANSFGLTNGKRQVLFVRRRQDVVMVQRTETCLHDKKKHSRFSIVSQSQTLRRNACFFLLHSKNCGNAVLWHQQWC